MNKQEEKDKFVSSAIEATNGNDGNFEFTCPLCEGYAIGVRKSWFGSVIASCTRCKYSARGEVQKSA